MADLQIIQHVKAGNISALKKCNKKDLSKTDESGWCAVHWAAWSGNRDAVLTILNKRLGLPFASVACVIDYINCATPTWWNITASSRIYTDHNA